MSAHGRHGHGHTGSRQVVSLIFGFFLSLALLAEVLLLVVHVGVFSQAGFLSVLDDAYYEYALAYVNDQATYYTLPTGIGTEVLEGVFGQGELRRDAEGYVNGAFIGVNYEPDLSRIESKLHDNVIAFFSGSGVEVTAETEEIASSYASEIVVIYRSVAKMPGLDAIASVRSRLVQFTLIGAVAIAVLLVVLVAALLRMHHYAHRALRYVAYAMGGAAIMAFAVPFAIWHSGAYLGIGLTPQYFYHFGISLIEHVLRLCMIGGGALLAMMLATIVLVGMLRRKVIERHKGGRARSTRW